MALLSFGMDWIIGRCQTGALKYMKIMCVPRLLVSYSAVVLQHVYGFSVKSSFLWLYSFFAGFFSLSRSHVLLSGLFILSDQMPLVKQHLQDCCLYAHAYRLYNAIFRFGNS